MALGLAVFSAEGADVDVRDFGARGDGQRTTPPPFGAPSIASCADGGGTVRFPAGEHLSYTIRLKSRPTLHLGQGAVLVAAEPSEGSLIEGFRTRLVRGYTEDRPTGRIKLGTESNGGYRNIAIANCVLDCSRGLSLESVDGALMEDVAITNLTMRDVLNAPI